MENLNAQLNEPWLRYKTHTPSLRVRILQLFLTKFDFQNLLKSRNEIDKIAKLAKIKLPYSTKIEEINFKNFKATYIIPKNANKEKVILCLHGGGYIAGGGDYCRLVGMNIAKYSGWQTLTVDYRLAPENPYPAALEDALVAYKKLLGEGIEPSNIVLYGDSAGGGLCFALCHRLNDSNLPLPKAIIALSPWTDLSASGESYKTNVEKDPILLFLNGGPGFHYVQGENTKTPCISPLFGNFSNFPKIFIVVGENEILLSDSLSIGEKAHIQGVDVQVHLWQGMFHIFPVLSRLLPESKKAMNEISEYLNNLI